MALVIEYPVTRNSLGDLDTNAFVRLNFNALDPNQTSRTSATTVKGVLGGSVAVVKGPGQIGAPVPPLTATGPEPLGLYENDAVTVDFTNTPAAASGKGPYLCGSGTVCQTDIYETKTTGGGTITYTAGDQLYCSGNGFLTNEAPTNANFFNPRLVAVLLLPPTNTNPFMRVQLAL